MNVDRQRRDRLVEAINRYLDEQTSAFEFDDQIDEISDETDDLTVNHVIDLLWYHYDDCTNHKVTLCKEEWDYFQRLILLLKSNSHLEVHKQREWSIRQLIAAIALVLFGLSSNWLGFGEHLLVVAVPFGFVSIFLSWWENKTQPKDDRFGPVDLSIYPFATGSQLLKVRRKVHEFNKRSYPTNIGTRTIRSSMMGRAFSRIIYVYWLILSPLVLLFQMFPDSHTETRVTTT